jgi:two-component system cell cycle response regulator
MSEKKMRVLLAEGDSGETSAALRALFPEEQNRLDLTIVSAVSTLIATFEIVNPEVIFLDLSLAHPDALDVVRYVHRATPGVPLIVVAGAADKHYAEQSVSEGAMDYLEKGFLNAKTIERVLNMALEHNTLGGLADLLRDPLTGLYIRDGLLTLGARAMETAKRRGSTLVLICIRIENLPGLRAEFGLAAVDTALREVAGLLKGSFRRTDIVARIGKSQLAGLAVDAIEPSGPVLCQRLNKRIAALNRERGSHGPLELRMNVGFWSSKGEETFPEFLGRVESGLRLPEFPDIPDNASQKTVSAVKDK